MITKKILLLSLFIVVSCTQTHTMDIPLRQVQTRMAYLLSPEYQTYTSLENTKELIARFNTPEMSTKINTARENAQATPAYIAYNQANINYLALKNAS